MSAYAAHEMLTAPQKSAEQRAWQGFKAARLAARSLLEKIPDSTTPEQMAELKTTKESYWRIAVPLTDLVAESLKNANKVSAERHLPDGQIVNLEYAKQTITTAKGNTREVDPRRGKWNLNVTNPVEHTKQTFRIDLHEMMQGRVPDAATVNEKGKVHKGYEHNLRDELVMYQKLNEYLNSLASGLKDKSTLIERSYEQLERIPAASRGRHASRLHKRQHLKLVHA